MPSEEWRVDLTANNELSDEARDAAKALDKLPDKVEVQIEADADGPKRDIDQLVQKLDKLGSGEAANLLLTTNADQIVREIADLALKLDALDADDPNVDVTISNLQQAQGDLERLSSKAKELNDTPIDIGSKTSSRGGFDKIIDGADQANSSVANMVGNSAQDLGELAGVTGSAGVAVGQLAEYFTDSAFAAKNAGQGFSQLFKTFGSAIGPIAAISAAIYGITTVVDAYKGQAQNAAEIEAFNVENAEVFKDAGEDILDIIDAYIDKARGAGSVEVAPNADQQTEALKRLAQSGETVYDTIQRMKKAGQDFEFRTADEGVVKLRDQLIAAKVTAQEFFQAADPRAGGGALDAFIDKVKASGASLTDQAQIISGVLYQQEQYRTGAQEAADDVAIFGEKTEDSKEALKEQEKASKDAADAMDLAAAAAAEAAERFVAMSEATGALRALTEQADVWERRAGAFATAFDFGNDFRDAAGQVRDIAIAIDGLSEAAEGVSGQQILGGDIGADAILDQLDSLRPEIQARITDAFATQGTEAGVAMANDYIDSVTAELGGKLSREQVAELLNLSDLEAKVKVGVEADSVATARAQLDILTGLNGQTPYTASIALALDAKTITGEQAQTLVQAQLAGAGVEIPSALQAPSTGAAIAEANAALAASPAVLPLAVSTDSVASAVADAAAVVEGTEANITVGADTQPGKTETEGLVKSTEAKKPQITVGASTTEAVNTILYVMLLTALLKPTLNVGANTAQAEADINNAARSRNTFLNVQTAGVASAASQLENLTQSRSVTIRPNVVPTSVLVRVDGG